MPNIRLYGNDHSPWVQAVMLGLHQKGMDYQRSTVPAPEAFIHSGVWMPAMSIDGEPWELESSDMLQKIGFSEVSEDEMKDIRKTWRGVLHRADHWSRFWGEFSLAAEPESSMFLRVLKSFFRSFVVLYFFLLIRFGVLSQGYNDPDDFADQYLDWEEKFKAVKGRFLGGDEPDSVDLLLFGILQCHCSIPVPPITALQADPRLGETRRWIADMQDYFESYGSIYSGVYFKPHRAAPNKASGLDQLAFWLGAAFMVFFFWLTVPLVALLVYRSQRFR